jgi:plasmid stabilization system protein ParE
MKVSFTPQARSDLKEILHYIDKFSPRGALNAKAAIKQTASLIGKFPNAGRSIDMQDIRVLRAGSYPYLVY